MKDAGQSVILLDDEAMRRALTRVAHEILERNGGSEGLLLLGVMTRGVPLARRISSLIKQFEDAEVPMAELDVTPYRDDRGVQGVNNRLFDTARLADPERPPLSLIQPPPDVEGKRIVLVDDVLYTGRTVRAAIDAIMDIGRPTGIQLAVLVDRGHRELPIRADYVGKNVPTSHTERIQVHLVETDGTDEVLLVRAALPKGK
ncbi:MAG: bifunctional pyr operon transcriptional regulator/uracil phosphoribosyltransferase PyrR [Chloroflexia bacterium]